MNKEPISKPIGKFSIKQIENEITELQQYLCNIWKIKSKH